MNRSYKNYFLLIFSLSFLLVSFRVKTPFWGFFAHKQINRLAVYTLPPELIGFYKKNLEFITENAVNPDQRRYVVKNEAPRHFIDLDSYGDSAATKLPRFWKDAVIKFGEDSLLKHGIVPWHIQLMKYQLTEAFKAKNTKKILQLSADLGHYIADANVPLHTTKNYNGQFTNQVGIHGFWESRLPELFSEKYDFFIGQAQYVESPQKAAWQAVANAHAALDSVFIYERQLTKEVGEDKKYSFEERNGLPTKVYSQGFSGKYHQLLKNQVERQMRASVKMIGDFWLTCWIDAGQPDLSKIADYQLTKSDLEETEKEKQSWLKRVFNVREE